MHPTTHDGSVASSMQGGRMAPLEPPKTCVNPCSRDNPPRSRSFLATLHKTSDDGGRSSHDAPQETPWARADTVGLNRAFRMAAWRLCIALLRLIWTKRDVQAPILPSWRAECSTEAISGVAVITPTTNVGLVTSAVQGHCIKPLEGQKTSSKGA